MSKQKWESIDKFLIENQDLSYREVSEILGIEYQRLRDRARYIGLRKHRHINWTEEILDYMRDQYKNGARPIANKFKIPITAINKKAQELGLKYEPKDSYIDMQGYRVNGKSNNRQYEHREVMEKHLERKLTSREVVHHIDGDKLNNDIDNLVITNRADHMDIHREEIQGKI